MLPISHSMNVNYVNWFYTWQGGKEMFIIIFFVLKLRWILYNWQARARSHTATLHLFIQIKVSIIYRYHVRGEWIETCDSQIVSLKYLQIILTADNGVYILTVKWKNINKFTSCAAVVTESGRGRFEHPFIRLKRNPEFCTLRAFRTFLSWKG